MCFLGADSFFVKEFTSRYTKARCIKDSGQIQSSGRWGNLFFLELSYNSCLDPAAQFRFRDNGAMLNLQRQGCLAAFHKADSGYDLDMFYLYVDSVSLDTAACAQKPNQGIYRAINQTSKGALSVYYKGKDKSSFETWCAVRSKNDQLRENYGINYHLGLRTPCDSYRLIFGKFLSNIYLCLKQGRPQKIFQGDVRSFQPTDHDQQILPTTLCGRRRNFIKSDGGLLNDAPLNHTLSECRLRKR